MTIIDFAYSMTAPAEAIMMFMMFDVFLEQRKSFKLWQYGLGVTVLALLIMVVNKFLMFTLENKVAMFAAAFVVSFFFYKGMLIKKIIAILVVLAISDIAEIVTLYSVTFIFQITVDTVLRKQGYLLLGVVVSKLLGLAICNIVRVKSRIKYLKIEKTYWLLFFMLLASTVFTVSLLFWMTYELNNTDYNVFTIVCSLALVFSTFFGSYLYERLAQQSETIHQQEQFEQQMNSQLKHMDEIILNQEELRRFKHDINNQIVALESYFENGDLEGGRRHMAALSQQFRAIGATINTGNNALDAILSTKKSLAESKGIVFNTEIRIQERLPLDAKDLCIIFGNALDNAIEACDRLPEHAEKRIDLLLVQDAHALFCTLSNTAPANNDRRFTTSKADTINHGFGLQNIRDALANYDAEPLIEQEGETFSLSFNIVLQ